MILAIARMAFLVCRGELEGAQVHLFTFHLVINVDNGISAMLMLPALILEEDVVTLMDIRDRYLADSLRILKEAFLY